MEMSQLVKDIKESVRVIRPIQGGDGQIVLDVVKLNLNGVFLLDPRSDKYTLYATQLGDKIKPHALQNIYVEYQQVSVDNKDERPELSNKFVDTLNQVIQETQVLIQNETDLKPKKMRVTVNFCIQLNSIGELKLLPVEIKKSMNKLDNQSIQTLILEFK